MREKTLLNRPGFHLTSSISLCHPIFCFAIGSVKPFPNMYEKASDTTKRCYEIAKNARGAFIGKSCRG